MKLPAYLVHLWKTDRAYFLLVAAVAILPWSLSVIVGWFFSGEISDVSAKPAFEAGFFIATALTMALGLSPTTLVATSAGYFFGWPAFIWVVASYLVAAILGRIIGVALNISITGSKKFVDEKADQFFSKMAHKPFLLLIFCRLSPVLTFALTNVALGRMRFRMATYTLATLIGMLPRTILVFYAGTQASEWNKAFESGQINHLRIAMVIGLLVISVIGIGLLARQALKRVANN